MGKLDRLLEIQPPKNWRTSRDGGPRKIVRPDLRLASEERVIEFGTWNWECGI